MAGENEWTRQSASCYQGASVKASVAGLRQSYASMECRSLLPLLGLPPGGGSLPASTAFEAQRHLGGLAPRPSGPGVDTNSVLHYIRVMRTRLRNITLTLEERLARWARLEAARRDTSVSRLLAGILEERMLEQDVYRNAMRRALARKPFLRTNGRYLSREEAHDRSGLR